MTPRRSSSSPHGRLQHEACPSRRSKYSAAPMGAFMVLRSPQRTKASSREKRRGPAACPPPAAQLAATAVASRFAMKALMRSTMRATSGSGQPAVPCGISRNNASSTSPPAARYSSATFSTNAVTAVQAHHRAGEYKCQSGTKDPLLELPSSIYLGLPAVGGAAGHQASALQQAGYVLVPWARAERSPKLLPLTYGLMASASEPIGSQAGSTMGSSSSAARSATGR